MPLVQKWPGGAVTGYKMGKSISLDTPVSIAHV